MGGVPWNMQNLQIMRQSPTRPAPPSGVRRILRLRPCRRPLTSKLGVCIIVITRCEVLFVVFWPCFHSAGSLMGTWGHLGLTLESRWDAVGGQGSILDGFGGSRWFLSGTKSSKFSTFFEMVAQQCQRHCGHLF